MLQLSGSHLKPTANPAKRIAVGGEEKARPAYEKALRPFHRLRAFSELVRLKGLEPTRIAAREPKGDVTLVKVLKMRCCSNQSLYCRISELPGTTCNT